MSLGEFELIDRLLRPLAAGFPGALALRDDAALVDVPPERQLVVAKDALVAGVHFLPEDPADLVAGKLLRVNLSDLAAMGAEPLAYLTVIGLVAVGMAPVATLLTLATLPKAWSLVRLMASGVEGRPLGAAVRGSARLHMLFGAALALGYGIDILT